MYNLYIPLCGLVLSIVLLFLYCFKVAKLREENAFYLCMIIDAFIMTLFCIVAVFLLYKFPNLESIIKLSNKIECAAIFNFFASLLMYIVYLSKLKSKKTNLIYIITNIIMIAIIFITPVELEVTSDLTYMVSVGTSVDITTISAGVMLVFTFFLAIKNKKILKQKILPIILLLVFIVLVVIIRGIKPEFICLEFLATVATLIMYHTIENPDVKLINELELAKSTAEKANRAKSDFLSSMSHEIRTPLNAIVGLSECIKNSDNLDEIHEDANDVVMASNNLLEIVNGILDISKIEADKMEIIERNYNPIEVFNELKTIADARIGEKEIELRCNFAIDLPNTLYGDKGKLKQIITNMLSNAVKYTEKGYIDFNVSCINDNDKCKLQIIVSDTGRGIKNDKIDTIFNKFERAEEDKNSTIEGTGLGLAITKALVEMMGGKIIVHSTYGEGSKFTVLLEQKYCNNEENTKVVNDEKVSYSDKKVLIVDDNKLNIKVASKVLSEFELNIDSCDSGFRAIEKIENNEYYDIIFMDIMMPKMSGVETLKKLKEIDNFNTPVVALTADAMEGKSTKYIEVGFNDYLSKPINKEELKRVLNKCLNGNDVYEEKVIEEDPNIHRVIPVTDEQIEALNKKMAEDLSKQQEEIENNNN